MWQKVYSSHINKVLYNKKKQTLTVEFSDNSRYIYYDVPQYLYISLMERNTEIKEPDVTTAGQFFSAEIRTKFTVRKLRGSQ